MKNHHIAQYSDAWVRQTAGVPSASKFASIVTPAGKPSSGQDGYMNALLAEWLMGARDISGFANAAMERGLELEPEACRWFEFEHRGEGLRLEHGSWITLDDGSAGCSADYLVYRDDELLGGLEMKCPEPATHVGYLRESLSVAKKYKQQVQGGLFITQLPRWWTLSYHPMLPPAVTVEEPDVAWHALFGVELRAFNVRLRAERQRFIEAGIMPPEGVTHAETQAA